MIANGVRDAKIIQQGNYPSTDKIFNDSYGKQGLQPRGIGGDPAEDNSAQNGVRSVKKETRQGILPTETKSVNQAPQPSPLGNTLNIATKNLALKTLVTAVNNSAVAWSGSLWLFLQLPLALMFIATLGIVGFIQGVADSNIILGAVAWAVNAVTVGSCSSSWYRCKYF
jgi:hypothetical protein